MGVEVEVVGAVVKVARAVVVGRGALSLTGDQRAQDANADGDLVKTAEKA